MGLFDRFFGRPDRKANPAPTLVANMALENPLSLQILFARRPVLSAAELTRSLRAADRDLKQALVEIDAETADNGTPLGLAGWGDHVIRLVGFDAPMPGPVVESCVQPSHYGPELKARARAHQAHLLLYYAGRTEDSLEQYVALAAVACILAAGEGVVVLNESAHTSFPAQALAAGQEQGRRLLVLLRELPLLVLYAGFVKYAVEGVPGVWMRTYGCPLLGLPDLALLAGGHEQSQDTFNLFCNVLNYVRTSGATLGAGHTMQVGPDAFLRLRSPGEGEYFLDSTGELFVAEVISADQINRGRPSER